MSALDIAKKAGPNDWHPADIVAALRKAGWSLRRLSRHHGYSPWTLKTALARPYPNGERIIAHTLGVEPKEIWPSRYKTTSKNTTPGGRRNTQKHRTA